MSSRPTLGVFLFLSVIGLATPQAAGISEQQADAFAKKLATVTARGVSGAQVQTRGPQRTPFTEVEVNSWFAYRSQELMPTGVSEPRVTIVGDGKLRGGARLRRNMIRLDFESEAEIYHDAGKSPPLVGHVQRVIDRPIPGAVGRQAERLDFDRLVRYATHGIEDKNIVAGGTVFGSSSSSNILEVPSCLELVPP